MLRVDRSRRSAFRRVSLILASVGLCSLVLGFLLARRLGGKPQVSSPRHAAVDETRRKVQSPHRSTVPRLVEQPSATVELVPGEPGYDPVKLAPFIAHEEMFAGEAENSAWAGAVERAVLKYDRRAAAVVVPGFEVTNVECRTTICLVRWKAPAEASRLVCEVIRQLIPGSLMTCTRNGEYYVAFAGGSGLYKDAAGDSDATIVAMTKDRQERAETILRRGGRGLHMPPEIVAAWPREQAQ
jgi:hypothetical protein